MTVREAHVRPGEIGLAGDRALEGGERIPDAVRGALLQKVAPFEERRVCRRIDGTGRRRAGVVDELHLYLPGDGRGQALLDLEQARRVRLERLRPLRVVVGKSRQMHRDLHPAVVAPDAPAHDVVHAQVSSHVGPGLAAGGRRHRRRSGNHTEPIGVRPTELGDELLGESFGQVGLRRRAQVVEGQHEQRHARRRRHLAHRCDEPVAAP